MENVLASKLGIVIIAVLSIVIVASLLPVIIDFMDPVFVIVSSQQQYPLMASDFGNLTRTLIGYWPVALFLGLVMLALYFWDASRSSSNGSS